MSDEAKSLKDWITKHGGFVNESLEVRTTESGYRGVYTRDCISKGKLLLRIPDACVIQFSPETSKFSASVELMVRLMEERKKEDSTYKPYLESLPANIESLLDWSPEEMENLSGTHLYTTAKSDCGGAMLLHNYTNNVKPKLSIAFENAEFLFAAKAVTSRSFSINSGGKESNKGPFLIPYVDLLNHSLSRKCTTIKRDSKTKSFFMEAEREIAANEEVFHRYGANLTNAQTLQTYGFVAFDGDTTPVTLMRDEVIQICRREGICPPENVEWNPLECWRAKVDVITERLPSVLPISLDNMISQELLTLLCVLCMPRESFIEYEAKPHLFEETILEDPSMGTIVYCTLHAIAEAKLNSYDEPLLSVISRLKSVPKGSRTELALTVKAEELRTLVGLQMLIRDQLSNLEASEDEYSEVSDSPATNPSAKRHRAS